MDLRNILAIQSPLNHILYAFLCIPSDGQCSSQSIRLVWCISLGLVEATVARQHRTGHQWPAAPINARNALASGLVDDTRRFRARQPTRSCLIAFGSGLPCTAEASCASLTPAAAGDIPVASRIIALELGRDPSVLVSSVAFGKRR